MNVKRFLLAAVMLAMASAAFGDNSKYVNLFLGTAGDHGQVSPAAQVPFGLVSVCPDCIPPQHAGYDYEVTAVSGISVTRMSGTGGAGTGGNLSIRPALPDAPLDIVKGTEKAHPGYYETRFANGVRTKLTATHNVAFERYEFPRNAEKVLYVDFNSGIDRHRSECGYNVLDENDINGWCRTSTVANKGAYTLFFHMNFSAPFKVERQDATTALLRFDGDVRDVEVRIALSPVDCASASVEMARCSDRLFGNVHAEAKETWNTILSKVDVQGSTQEQKVLFYTSMYRVYLSPFVATSTDGMYRGTDGRTYKASGWTYYGGWSMWDTYRTKFPMLAVLSPDAMSDICRSLVSLYVTGKKNWATMTESVPTVRTEHSQVTLLDAWSKGVRGFDMSEALPAMEQEVVDGLKPKSTQGLTRNAPDQKMETVYDLWALSRIAGICGKPDAANRYGEDSRSLFERTWKGEFMTITDRFALMKGNGMYQGTRWQYRWAAPMYSYRMKELVGSERLASQLSEFFSRHLFNQGNEPDIQTPFMFNMFGHPERTDSLVHALLTDERMIHIYGGNAEFPEPFVGRAFRNRVDGYAPEMDEDDGTMSAWYMFCQMGFYPVCPGTDSYELFTPLFKCIRMHLPTGELVIRRRCREASSTVIKVDGAPLEGRSISHSRLFGAKEIVFE